MKHVGRCGATLALALVSVTGAAEAQTWPDKPVRIIVPLTAGSATDVMARTVAQRLTEQLGQPFIVENKPGAGSNVAAEYVARAPNDGYTIFMATAAQTNYAGMTINPSYDVVKDFAPILRVAAVPTILVAYNWPAGSDRYRRVARFTDYLFNRVDKLQAPGFDPKWQTINLGATVPGLTRFQAAQEWLDRQGRKPPDKQ